MALQAGGVKLPGIGMTLVANAESPTKILCLTEVVLDFNTVLQVKHKVLLCQFNKLHCACTVI